LVFTIGADELYQEPSFISKILRIREVEEVEENIALNTLGTIIHETLKSLYDPFVGRFISESDIQNCFKQIDDEVLKQFKVVYKEGEIKKGRNLLLKWRSETSLIF
jgi:hypothetical protein